MWGQLSCCSCLRPRRSNVPTDDCCRCNLAALKTVTGLSDQDLLCVSFHNRVYEVQYFYFLFEMFFMPRFLCSLLYLSFFLLFYLDYVLVIASNLPFFMARAII